MSLSLFLLKKKKKIAENRKEGNKKLTEQLKGGKTADQTQTLTGPKIPMGGGSCDPNKNQIIQGSTTGDKNSRSKLVQEWQKALDKVGLKGITWIGKLNSNGPGDSLNRFDTGRDVIIFAPCTTNFNNPVEIMYYFHGNNGFSYIPTDKKNNKEHTFDDFNVRIAPQSKQMSNGKRNFVLVFPELPWSAGEPNLKRRKQSSVWKSGDSNLLDLHNDALSKIKSFAPNLNVGYISMTGHSAGGSALHNAAVLPSTGNNFLSQVKVNKITFSDADYGWRRKSGCVDYSCASSWVVYDNYVKNHPAVELNLIAQDSLKGSPHEPTMYSLLTMKHLGKLNNWKVEGMNGKKHVIPGVVSGEIFSVPEAPNVNYVPLTTGHYGIGKTSLAWLSGKQYISTSKIIADTGGKCFPLSRDSYNGRISENFGDPRSGGDRCHVGVDVYNHAPGKVVALEDGIVLNVRHFYNCSDGWGTGGNEKRVAAVYIYNPSEDRTINYGEIDEDKVKVSTGQKISAGMELGIASYCGTSSDNAMLHFEMYSGEKTRNIWWKNPGGSCPNLGTKDPSIQNPTALLKSLEGKYCDGGQQVQPNPGEYINTQRQKPTTCTYDNGNYNAADVKKIPYSSISGEIIDPAGSGCTACREDQVTVSACGKNFKVCWKLAEQVTNAVQAVCNSGFPINDIVGFREGRTYNTKKSNPKYGQHPYGAAIDINRAWNGLYNGCKTWDIGCKLSPNGGEKNKNRDPGVEGTITKSSAAYQILTGQLGWHWGGDWTGNQKDYMHFSNLMNR